MIKSITDEIVVDCKYSFVYCDNLIIVPLVFNKLV